VPAIQVPTLETINPVQSKTKLRDCSAAKPPRLDGSSTGAVGAEEAVSESWIAEVEATGAELGWTFIVANSKRSYPALSFSAEELADTAAVAAD
jgi:hypothetical protein